MQLVPPNRILDFAAEARFVKVLIIHLTIISFAIIGIYTIVPVYSNVYNDTFKIRTM